MISPQPFHIRKALNVLVRRKILAQTTKRNLSNTLRSGYADTISIDEEPLTADETMRYLRYQDQVKLRETHSALNTYLRHIRALHDFATKHTSLKLSSTSSLAPYSLSTMRQRAQRVESAKAQALKAGTGLKEHLTDLQQEPYKADMDEQLRVWEREIALMDDYEVLDMYQSSDLEDAAKLNRLTKQVNALSRRVNIAAGLQSEEEPEHYPDAVADPFAKQKVVDDVDSNAVARQEKKHEWEAPKQTRVQTAAHVPAEAKAGESTTGTQRASKAPSKSHDPAQRRPDKPASASARRGRRERATLRRSDSGDNTTGTSQAIPDNILVTDAKKSSISVASPEAATQAKLSAAKIARRKSLAEEQRRLEADMQQGQLGPKVK